jgi:pectinesterase
MKKIISAIWVSLWIATGAHASGKIFRAVVASDGSGDYKSVQAAIDAVPDNNLNQYNIYIKPGTYKEHVFIPRGKGRLSLIGEDCDKVFISDDRKSGGPNNYPVDMGATVVIHACDVTLQGISFVNSHGYKANDGPQALALYAKGDRIAMDHCKILGFQDTYRTPEADNGRNYLSNCLILGGIDFIYGNGNVWFEKCTIKVNLKKGGWIVAPKHRPETRWGYVFNSCKLTADGDLKKTSIWLGRPWHHQPQTVYLNTRSEITLPAEGWYPTMNGLPSVFAEYNTMDGDGRPIDLSKRINRYYRIDEKGDTIWCTAKNVLTAEEAALYTVEAVMSGDDLWQPKRIFLPSEKPAGYIVVNGRSLPVNEYGCFYREPPRGC